MPSRRKSRTVAAVSSADQFLRLLGRRRDVRRRDDLRQLGERPVGRRLLSRRRRAPAPATMPCSIARRSAASSISSPRAVLMMRMPGLQRANRSSLNRCLVSGVDGRCSVRKSAVAHSSSSVSSSTPSAGGDLLRDERIVGDDRACRTRARAARPPGRCVRGRRCRASCRAARCRETASSPTGRPSSRDRRRDRARQRQHQRAGVLGDADAVGAGRVDDEDAAGAGGGDVDVVDAGAGAGDDAQPRRGVQQRRGRPWSRCGPAARRRRRDRRPAPSGVRPERASTTQPASARSSSSAEAGRSSATTIFNATWMRLRTEAAHVVDDVPELTRRHLAVEAASCRVPLTPSRMTVKISPSVEPCFQSASVRFDGFGVSSRPSCRRPCPASPWQPAHCCS